MEFVTGTLTACTSNNHLSIPVTINGVTKDLKYTKAEIDDESQLNSIEEARNRILDRLISAVKEAGASTPIQIRNAVSNKTFRV